VIENLPPKVKSDKILLVHQSFASQNLGGQANFPGRLAWQGEGGEHFLLTNFYFQKPSNLEFYVNYYSCRFY